MHASNVTMDHHHDLKSQSNYLMVGGVFGGVEGVLKGRIWSTSCDENPLPNGSGLSISVARAFDRDYSIVKQYIGSLHCLIDDDERLNIIDICIGRSMTWISQPAIFICQFYDGVETILFCCYAPTWEADTITTCQTNSTGARGCGVQGSASNMAAPPLSKK